MNYLVVFDSKNLIKFLKKNSKDNLVIICADNLELDSEIVTGVDILRLRNFPDEESKLSCLNFTNSYLNKENVELVDISINNIYEYFVLPLNKLLYLIRENVKKDDKIILFGGNSKVKLPLFYGVKTAEFPRNFFIERADVFNPFLYEALNDKNNVHYYQDSIFRVSIKYFLRLLSLFTITYGGTLIKYIVGVIRTINMAKSSCDLPRLILPVRSNTQFDFADSITKFLHYNDSKVKPVILYYEMLTGKNYLSRVLSHPTEVTSLFNFRDLPYVLLYPVLLVVDVIKSLIKNREYRKINLGFSNYKYSLDINILKLDAFSSAHVSLYNGLLGRYLARIRKKNANDFSLLSTEMLGQQAFIERYCSDKHNVRFYNVQTCAVSDTYYPVKVVGNKTFCLSELDAKSFNEKGMNNFGNAEYIGDLKYLDSSVNNIFDVNLTTILFGTQPYEVEQSIDLLKIIIKIKPSETNVVIRLHPRDSKKNYTEFINDYDVTFDSDTLKTSLVNASLLVTRTSSIIYDAVQYGVPFVSCLLSDFDRSVEMDLLKYEEFTINEPREIMEIMCNYKDYFDLQKLMLTKKDISKLSDSSILYNLESDFL
ncbi:hypothetical protein AB4254_10315 [Vibrio breoganii]